MQVIEGTPYNAWLFKSPTARFAAFVHSVFLGAILLIHYNSQKIWLKFASSCSESFVLYAFIPIMSFFCHWSVALLMSIPLLLPKSSKWPLKLQPLKEVTAAEFWKIVRCTLYNQVVYGIAASALLTKIWYWRCGNSFPSLIPGTKRLLSEFICFYACVEVAFYYAHRAFHSRALYRLVHKKHHEFSAPIAVAAIYATPFEYVVGNIFPVFLGPILIGSHFVTMSTWIAFAMINSINSHCGFSIFGNSALDHDYHHVNPSCNFGVSGLLDWLHGTDVPFRRLLNDTDEKLKN